MICMKNSLPCSEDCNLHGSIIPRFWKENLFSKFDLGLNTVIEAANASERPPIHSKRISFFKLLL